MNGLPVKARHPLARRVTSAGLALVLVAAWIVACVPVGAAAAQAHCPPAAAMPDCPHPVLDCCDAPQQGSPALPEQTPASRADGAKSAAGLDTACGLAPSALGPLVAHAPLAPAHGYRFADLLTLHSVFLI
jgi:hypothetical protein